MGLRNSYFALPTLAGLWQRHFNPQVNTATISLRGEALQVSWTQRAAQALAQRSEPLLAEMQLYFSCVVKKRVVFHEHPPVSDLEAIALNDHLQVAFRPVEANSCDPVEFAANFPVRREFDSAAALRMHPKQLQIDYREGSWQGEFTI